MNEPRGTEGDDGTDRAMFDSAKHSAAQESELLSAITVDYRLGRIEFRDRWILSATELSLLEARTEKTNQKA